MPPLPSVPNTALCRVVVSQASHQSQNVLHFRWTGGPAAVGDMASLAEILFDRYSGLFTGAATGGTTYIGNDATLDYVTATDLTSPSGAFFKTTGASVPGAAAQKSIANSALLLSHSVGTRYRGGHGRTYLMGISPDNTDDGRTWDVGTIVADIDDWWTQTLTNVAAGTGHPYPTIVSPELVVVSYYDRALNPVPPYRRAVPVVYPVITSGIADQVIRSQRRRVRNTPTPT